MTQSEEAGKDRGYIEVRVPREVAELLLKLLEAIEKDKIEVRVLRKDSEGGSYG